MPQIRSMQERRRPLGRVAVAGTVKAVTLDAQAFLPFKRNRVSPGLGSEVKKSGLEERYQGKPRMPFLKRSHRAKVRRIVGGGQEGKAFHIGKHRVIDQAKTPVRSSVDSFKAYRTQLGQVGQRLAWSGNFAQARVNCRFVIRTGTLPAVRSAPRGPLPGPTAKKYRTVGT